MEYELKFGDVLEYVSHCVQEYDGHLLSEVEVEILRWTWEEDLSYGDMAKRMGYSQNTLRGVYGYGLWKLLSNVWSNEKKINKSKFNQVVKRRCNDWIKAQRNRPTVSTLTSPSPFDNSLTTPLLSRLVNTLNSGCHSLILTGAKGIGKSHLLKSVESALNGQFTQIVHHPIHQVPTWQTWHQTLFKATNGKSLSESSLTEHQLRQQVLQALNQNPYLMVIDQGERFVDDPKHNAFFKEITTASNHQSCLLWSGTILPNEIDRHNIPIETLFGLSFNQAKTLLEESYPHLANSLVQKEQCWKQLNQLCGGNPTLLHKTVDTLQSFYDNQIEQFVAHPLPLSPSLFKYFDDLVADLSEPEQVLLYWLALQPLSWIELKKWPLFLPFNERVLMQAWDMLQRRHFIRKSSQSEGLWQITPQYLGLYLISKLQEIFVQELLEEKLYLFHSHPIMLTNAPQEQQQILHKYLLKPVADSLQKRIVQKDLQAKLLRLINQLKTFCEPSRSCTAGNLFNLAAYMGISMADIKWTNLTLWHADLRVSGLQGIDFKGCQFKDTALPTGLQGQLVTALHPTGRVMAVGDEQGLLQIYQWTGQRFDLDWCCCLDFPIQEIIITDSDKLIVATIDQIQIWDSFTNRDNWYSAQLETVTLDSIAVRSNGDLLATGLSDGSIQLWDLAWAEAEGEPLWGDNNNVRHLTFSPDGKTIAGYDDNNRILIWHQVPSTNTYTAAEAQLPLNPYGNFLAFKWIDAHLKVVEAVPEIDSQEYRAKVAIRTFMVVEEILADDSMHHSVKELPYSPGQPQQAVFSDDGAYLVLCDIDHTVHVWCNMTPIPEKAIKLPRLPYALSICNGGRILLCQEATQLSLWDLAQQQCLQVWKSVSDLDQYRDCQFYNDQGLSNDELVTVQSLGAILCQL